MSASDVLLFVGATTLVAAIVALFLLQMTAARFERGINRKSHTLEGPVPGRRALSTIGLNTESARTAHGLPEPRSRQSTAQMAHPKEISPEIAQSTLSELAIQSLTEEGKLNSLQTIRARSEALHNDIESDQSAGPDSQTTPGTPAVQRLPKSPVSDSDQEQGPAMPEARTRTQKGGRADSSSPSSAPAGRTAAPTMPPKTTTSKRARRAAAQAPSETRTDQAGLKPLAPPQPSDFDGPLGQDGLLPDILAGLNDSDAGIETLADDLSDIDGGGLPSAAAPKTPQKSRR